MRPVTLALLTCLALDGAAEAQGKSGTIRDLLANGKAAAAAAQLDEAGIHHASHNFIRMEWVFGATALFFEDETRTTLRGHRSSTSVTGPSFTRSTSIEAPNSPVSTFAAPRSRSTSTKRS